MEILPCAGFEFLTWYSYKAINFLGCEFKIQITSKRRVNIIFSKVKSTNQSNYETWMRINDNPETASS